MFMTSLSLYLSLEYKQPKVLQKIIPKKVTTSTTTTAEVRKQPPPPPRQQQKLAKKEINIEQYEEVIESDDGNYGEESSSET